MTYYTIPQNNSGGYFIEDANIGQDTIIEAETQEDAEEIAERMGIEWGMGYSSCPCCGPRWSTWSITAADFPERNSWQDTAVIHYADGTIEYRGDKREQ